MEEGTFTFKEHITMEINLTGITLKNFTDENNFHFDINLAIREEEFDCRAIGSITATIFRSKGFDDGITFASHDPVPLQRAIGGPNKYSKLKKNLKPIVQEIATNFAAQLKEKGNNVSIKLDTEKTREFLKDFIITTMGLQRFDATQGLKDLPTYHSKSNFHLENCNEYELEFERENYMIQSDLSGTRIALIADKLTTIPLGTIASPDFPYPLITCFTFNDTEANGKLHEFLKGCDYREVVKPLELNIEWIYWV